MKHCPISKPNFNCEMRSVQRIFKLKNTHLYPQMHISIHLYLSFLGSLRLALMEIQQQWQTDRWVTASSHTWRTVMPFGISNEHFDHIVWVQEIDLRLTHQGSRWWGRGFRIGLGPVILLLLQLMVSSFRRKWDAQIWNTSSKT